MPVKSLPKLAESFDSYFFGIIGGRRGTLHSLSMQHDAVRCTSTAGPPLTARPFDSASTWPNSGLTVGAATQVLAAHLAAGWRLDRVTKCAARRKPTTSP